jgi:hypothetical protein
MKEPIMSPIPNYGDHMTLEEFVECCESGGFIDYDGRGDYATETEISDVGVRPSQITSGKIDTRWTHVVWYNR